MAFTLQALKNELTNDPLAVGYAGLNDSEAAAAMNDTARARPVERELIASNEVIDAVDGTEWSNLASDDLLGLQILTAREDLKIRGSNVRAILLSIFSPAGQFSATRSNLAVLQTRPGSRSEELFGEGFQVTPSQVADARRL